MRRVLYSVAMSLDGFIAGPKGEFDWIPMDPAIDWNAFMARFDTALMGRKTFELTLTQSGPETGMRTFVFSRTLKPSDHPKVTIVSEDGPAVVRRLKQEPGKDIWLFGGGVLFRSLLEAGVVDAVEVGLVPILLGEGLPFLPPPARRTSLKLTESRPFPSGMVMLNYAVQGTG